MSKPTITVMDSDWPVRMGKTYELHVPADWLIRTRWPRFSILLWLLKLAWQVQRASPRLPRPPSVWRKRKKEVAMTRGMFFKLIAGLWAGQGVWRWNSAGEPTYKSGEERCPLSHCQKPGLFTSQKTAGILKCS